MNLRSLALLALALSAGAATSAAAQGSIRGVLIDSLRTGEPLANAEVVLVGTGRRATTDERGRFAFRDVAAGEHAIAYWATWLDSAALPALEASASVRDGAETSITLRTPSRDTWFRALCDRPLDAGEAIVHGETRSLGGHASAGTAVSARWMETRLGAGLLERLMRDVATKSDATGRYVLCGVPQVTSIELEFLPDGDSLPHRLVILTSGSVQRRDLHVGAAGESVRVQGRLLDARGQAVREVVVDADLPSGARSDSSGRFSIELPARSAQIQFRAVGFVPRTVDVEPHGSLIDLGDIHIEPLPPRLAAMIIRGRPVSREEMGFEERRAIGLGGFVDEETLNRAPVITPAFVSSQVGFARLRPGGYNRLKIMLWRGSGPCDPRFFIDGYDYGALDPLEQEAYFAHAKRVEIYRATFAPPQFNDFNGCGAVVVWTR